MGCNAIWRLFYSESYLRSSRQHCHMTGKVVQGCSKMLWSIWWDILTSRVMEPYHHDLCWVFLVNCLPSKRSSHQGLTSLCEKLCERTCILLGSVHGRSNNIVGTVFRRFKAHFICEGTNHVVFCTFPCAFWRRTWTEIKRRVVHGSGQVIIETWHIRIRTF